MLAACVTIASEVLIRGRDLLARARPAPDLLGRAVVAVAAGPVYTRITWAMRVLTVSDVSNLMAVPRGAVDT